MASIRKSFLSALYGIYRAEGPIDLSQTMADSASTTSRR